MQVCFSVDTKHLFKDLRIMVLLVGSDMAFGDVTVQLVLPHVERRKTPGQKPQIGLHVKRVSVQCAGFPFCRRLVEWLLRFSPRVSVTLAYVPTQGVLARLTTCVLAALAEQSIWVCAYACSKATHMSSNVFAESKVLPVILNLRSSSGVCGAAVSKNQRALLFWFLLPVRSCL